MRFVDVTLGYHELEKSTPQTKLPQDLQIYKMIVASLQGTLGNTNTLTKAKILLFQNLNLQQTTQKEIPDER
jgi:hypothetical protein